MKKLLALFLAVAYLGSFTLHGVAHATDAKAETCGACQTGTSRVEAPAAPVVSAPTFLSSLLPEAAAAQASSGRLQACVARAPPAAS